MVETSLFLCSINETNNKQAHYLRDIRFAKVAKLLNAIEAWVGSDGGKTPYGWLNSANGEGAAAIGDDFVFNFSISASCSRFSLARLFWNHIFTCKYHYYYCLFKCVLLTFFDGRFSFRWIKFKGKSNLHYSKWTAPIPHYLYLLLRHFLWSCWREQWVINFNCVLIVGSSSL